MVAAFFFSIGCILIQFAIIGFVLMDSVATSKRNAELRIENARLLAMYDAVTYRRNTGQ